MYISGTQHDFENRLHQLPTGVNNLDSFLTEGLGYVGDYDTYEINRLNKEYNKKLYQFTRSGEVFSGLPFS